MSWARALAFNLALYAWTVIIGAIGLPFLVAPRAMTMRFGRFWSSGVLVLLRVVVGLDHQIRGLDCVPRQVAGPSRDRAVFAPDPRLCTAPRWLRAAAELAVV